MKKILILIAIACVTAVPSLSADSVRQGKELFHGAKFHCDQCHGMSGHGGTAPSFQGVAARFTKEQIMKRAAHNCPPTGSCNPKELGAIVDYLLTL